MAVWEGLEMHGHVVKIGFCFDMYVSTTLVDMYAKFGNLGLARRVFNDMTDRSLVSWTALIGGYVRRGDMGNAWFLFKLMPGRDSAAFNLMIDGYVKVGDMRCARSLFDEMPERNVISWTSMIYGYCNNGDVLSARSSTVFEPNEVTVVSILPAIATLGALELGEWICTQNVEKISKARKVFSEIPKKETATWNALINGFAMNGLASEALEAFSEMQREGIKPNDITMTGVLSACCHGGLVEEGKRRFKAMIESGFSPKIEYYGCLVDLLGRAGCLDESENLIKSMTFEANGIILSSSLFACGFSNDVTRAQRVLNQAVNMEPRNDGNYVMVRNSFAMEEWWRAVKEIKGLMRRSGAKKEVGSSAIEVDNRVSEFISGGIAHPEWDVIESVIGLSSTPLMSLFRSLERFEQIYGRTLPFIIHSEQHMQLRADSVIWANNDSSTALSENDAMAEEEKRRAKIARDERASYIERHGSVICQAKGLGC
ncbi:PPR CONTAINING PLANT-LIKE PROTEIN [Salix viminalis]|uniref:PPR CONTAINING PLANT-LIKE PROTEIN n=1 Tax=Salix viminalis TaxID=40686 RepID=A0A9Q0NTM7_SALVM|nr:PPR CONTAINING PLANT-LIKE PROTEIN [Salix viminalis]